MPPNTNDTPDQAQPTNPPSVPDTDSAPAVDDTVPPTVTPQPDSANTDSTPTSSESTSTDPMPSMEENSGADSGLASPPPVNEADIPANNRPTLDTINSPQEAPATTSSLESEIDKLPETAPLENPTPADTAPETPPNTEALDTLSSQAAEATPAPAPPAFPESSNAKPEKKGFFAKFFKHK